MAEDPDRHSVYDARTRTARCFHLAGLANLPQHIWVFAPKGTFIHPTAARIRHRRAAPHCQSYLHPAARRRLVFHHRGRLLVVDAFAWLVPIHAALGAATGWLRRPLLRATRLIRGELAAGHIRLHCYLPDHPLDRETRPR